MNKNISWSRICLELEQYDYKMYNIILIKLKRDCMQHVNVSEVNIYQF